MLDLFVMTTANILSSATPVSLAASYFASIWIYKKPQSMEFGLLLFVPLVWIATGVAMYGIFHAGRALARIKSVERTPRALVWLVVWLLAIGGIGFTSFSEYTGILMALPGALCALPAGVISARSRDKRDFSIVPVALVILFMPFAMM